MSTDNYSIAVDRFALEPEALTDGDLEVLKSVDDLLAQRATTKRRQAQIAAAAARHRVAMGEPAPKPDKDAQIADGVIDQIRIALADPRQRIKMLEGLIHDLRDRLVELEARRATEDPVNANH